MTGRGLADNPFSAARFAPGRVPWVADDAGEVARLFARASRPGALTQVLGPHGSGKSTLLAHLEAHARREGARVVRLRGSRGLPVVATLRLAEARGARVALVDEVEELSAPSVAALRALAWLTGVSVVATAHRDLGWPLLCERRVDGATAARVVAHLTAPSGAPVPAAADLDARLARHRGNLREVMFELYDEAEARARAG